MGAEKEWWRDYLNIALAIFGAILLLYVASFFLFKLPLELKTGIEKENMSAGSPPLFLPGENYTYAVLRNGESAGRISVSIGNATSQWGERCVEVFGVQRIADANASFSACYSTSSGEVVRFASRTELAPELYEGASFLPLYEPWMLRVGPGWSGRMVISRENFPALIPVYQMKKEDSFSYSFLRDENDIRTGRTALVVGLSVTMATLADDRPQSVEYESRTLYIDEEKRVLLYERRELPAGVVELELIEAPFPLTAGSP